MKRKAEKTVENLEKRKSARIYHTSPLLIKDLQSGKIHRAKMFNYSNEGFYFESDSDLNPGIQIYIGIKNSPYASLFGVLEYHRGEIVRRKKLKDSFFRFGYGVKLAILAKKQDLKLNGIKKIKDSRKHRRRQCNKFILFTAQSGIFEGTIKNISSPGAFLISKRAFEVGEVLTLVLPFKNGKFVKVNGRIVWKNDEGFGIRFLSIDK